MSTYEHIIVKAGGGSSPDPAEYCPANGYVDETTVVPNPLSPEEGWQLLCEFQTNSPSNKTFDPIISKTSGEFAWSFSDGTTIKGVNALNPTYYFSDSTTKTVKLYGRNTPILKSIDMYDDNIVGVLDLSNVTFSDSASINIGTNSACTGFVLPETLKDVTVKLIGLAATGLIGTLDLRNVQKLDNQATINITNIPLLAGILFPSSVTGGSITQLNIATLPSLVGEINISAFTNFQPSGASSSVTVNACAQVQSITTPTSMTGILDSISFTGLNSVSSLDLRGYTKFSLTNGQFYVYSMPSLATLQLPTIESGKIVALYVYGTALSGTLDLTGFYNFSSVTMQLYSNPSIQEIRFAPSLTGNLSALNTYSCNLTTLDLTMWTTFATTFIMDTKQNPNLHEIRFASSITGTMFRLYADRCNLTGTLDLSMWQNLGTGFQLDVYSNALLQNINFASSITGTLMRINAYYCGLTGTLDLSGWKNFVSTGVDIALYNNYNLQSINFSSTPVSGPLRTLQLSNNTSLGYIDFTKLSVAIANMSFLFTNCNLSTAIVNRMLVDLNAIATSGYSGRLIRINENNYPCDTTTGGYNGESAKTSLISKSFTVTTVVPPTISATTTAISSKTQTSANSGGNVTNVGNGIVERGVCWSTSSNPTFADSKVISNTSTSTGSYSSTMTGLTANTLYYVKSFAKNYAGVVYGNEINFTTLP